MQYPKFVVMFFLALTFNICMSATNASAQMTLEDGVYPIGLEQAEVPLPNPYMMYGPVVDPKAEDRPLFLLLQQALERIRSYASHPMLQTYLDQQIYGWLEAEGRTVDFSIQILGSDAPIASYSCQSNMVRLNGSLQTNLALLTGTLYHEFAHAAQCERERYLYPEAVTDPDTFEFFSALNIPSCYYEAEGYSAGVRMAAVQMAEGVMPIRVTRESAKRIREIGAVWGHLLRGSFCTFYDDYVLHK